MSSSSPSAGFSAGFSSMAITGRSKKPNRTCRTGPNRLISELDAELDAELVPSCSNRGGPNSPQTNTRCLESAAQRLWLQVGSAETVDTAGSRLSSGKSPLAWALASSSSSSVRPGVASNK